MGLIERILGVVFGGGRNVVAETAEVFRVNAEADAARDHDLRSAALTQFGHEFAVVRRGWFDRFMDAMNRVPRPAMALGTMGLFVAAMVDPVWFAARMAGIALVPEPLWWLLGAIVSFYFGARHQAKGQEFQRDLAATMAAVPQVVKTVRDVHALRDVTPDGAEEQGESFADNPALAAWDAERR
ncbi:holin family protein [uncultured Pelagimonas sp.]|uniref:holin family protein n=1 Tax=uncultured Pelagimonas sp. TaxID=1618102 RepID=UPI00262D1F15|nr:holin family protein [uncultured Pelagimonas sp.]